ncbi:MAG TPA: cell division protein FtsL [Gammaproteobacteria bacterium]
MQVKRWLIFLVLLAGVVSASVGLVYTKHINRKMFVELNGLQKSRDRMMTELGQLQLEHSTWSTHGRVEKIARQQLRMSNPRFDAVEIIRR